MSTVAPAVALFRCPRCRESAPIPMSGNTGIQRCGNCRRAWELALFPSARVVRPPREPVAAAPGEPTCFAHAGNRAETDCADCGRLICATCASETPDGVLCPSCQVARARDPKRRPKRRILWGSMSSIASLVSMLVGPLAPAGGLAGAVFLVLAYRQPPGPLGGRTRSLAVATVALALNFAFSTLVWIAILRS